MVCKININGESLTYLIINPGSVRPMINIDGGDAEVDEEGSEDSDEEEKRRQKKENNERNSCGLEASCRDEGRVHARGAGAQPERWRRLLGSTRGGPRARR